jgi:hypothetical protein
MRCVYSNIDWMQATSEVDMKGLRDKCRLEVMDATGKMLNAKTQCLLGDLTPSFSPMSELDMIPVSVQSKPDGRVCIVSDSWMYEIGVGGRTRIEFWGRHFAAGRMRPHVFLRKFAECFPGAPELPEWKLTRVDLASDFVDFDRSTQWQHADIWTGLGASNAKLTVVSSVANGVETIYLGKGGHVSLCIYNKTLQLSHISNHAILKCYDRNWQIDNHDLYRDVQDKTVFRVELRLRAEPLRELKQTDMMWLDTGLLWSYGTGAWCRPKVLRGGRADRAATDARWAEVRSSWPGGVNPPPKRKPVPGRGSTPAQAVGVLRSALVYEGWSRAEADALTEEELMEVCGQTFRGGRGSGRGHTGRGND